MRPSPNLTALILTLNEETNLNTCIKSLLPLTDNITVIDSFSTDRTVEIAQSLGAKVIQNKFSSYSQQRNFALTQTQISTEWILFLDADEKITPELAQEITELLQTNPIENGFKIKRRLVWNKKWIKHGYYPVWILRLARLNKVRCEDLQVNEHLLVEGGVGKLTNDFINEDLKGIDHWHIRHLRYAELEAEALLKPQNAPPNLSFKTNPKRWIKYRIWIRLPSFLRPWLYFAWRYFIQGGFLEGWQGISFHFFQSLWLHMLISHKIKEKKHSL